MFLASNGLTVASTGHISRGSRRRNIITFIVVLPRNTEYSENPVFASARVLWRLTVWARVPISFTGSWSDKGLTMASARFQLSRLPFWCGCLFHETKPKLHNTQLGGNSRKCALVGSPSSTDGEDSAGSGSRGNAACLLF